MAFSPGIGGQTGFHAKMGKKLFRSGQLLPDLWQKSGTGRSLPKYNAIHINTQLGKQIFAATVFQGIRLGKDADLDVHPVEFSGF